MKLRRRLKYYLIRLFRIEASPNQVALGLALGFIPNWFPTFGLGPILSAGLAKLLKVNVLAAIVGGIVGTPLWPFLFLLNYKTGSIFHKNPNIVNDLEDVEYIEAATDTVASLQSGSLQFLTGAMLNVILSFLLIYLVVYMVFKRYRHIILMKLKYNSL